MGKQNKTDAERDLERIQQDDSYRAWIIGGAIVGGVLLPVLAVSRHQGLAAAILSAVIGIAGGAFTGWTAWFILFYFRARSAENRADEVRRELDWAERERKARKKAEKRAKKEAEHGDQTP